MDLKGIISNSLKYPFRNIKKLSIIFIFLIIVIAIILIGMRYGNNYLIILGFVGILLFILVVPGYLLSVVLKGSAGSSILPSFNFGKNIYDTIRLFVLRILYMIIPVGVFLVVLVTLGLTSIDFLYKLQVFNFIATVVVMLLLILIIYVVFEFLLFFAKARLAYFDSLIEALKIHKVIIDIKNIGFKNVIKWLIVTVVLMSVFSFISSWVVLIPYVGFLIYLFVVIPVMESISNYSLGVLYSNLTDSGEDLDKFEKEIKLFKYFKK